MAKPRPRIKLPRSAGVPFTVKTRITHPMHTGLRRDRDGKLVPRRIVNRFAVRFEGEEVLSVALEPAVSTNPYIQFAMAVPGPGLLAFEWVDDDGSVYSLERRIAVS
ncbi:MAG: thiosulfate oxidation carrier complex protein SoxZ [Alphaproteobacteria bacterium]|nr:thiosulfate oxidation carrier complex protein SoxZ [Alphaproteobacteria bacterium]